MQKTKQRGCPCCVALLSGDSSVQAVCKAWHQCRQPGSKHPAKTAHHAKMRLPLGSASVPVKFQSPYDSSYTAHCRPAPVTVAATWSNSVGGWAEWDGGVLDTARCGRGRAGLWWDVAALLHHGCWVANKVVALCCIQASASGKSLQRVLSLAGAHLFLEDLQLL